MFDRTVSLSELVADGQIEIGAGRPRSVNANGFDLPVLKVADVLDGKIDSSFPGAQRVYREEMGSKVSKPGDIILTTKGTVGRVAMVRPDGPIFAYSPQLCYFRPNVDGPLEPRFLYYWFKSVEFWNQADALKGQTDMADFLSLSDVFSLKVRVPTRVQQKGVADILGALDDKIAGGERISATTDELASAMFEELMASDAGVGEVLLSEVADINKLSVKASKQGMLRYVDISSVGVGDYEWPEPIQWSEAPGRARRKADVGDTIWSTVRPNRRSHALVLDNDDSLVFSTGLAVLSPRNVGPAFLYEATRTASFQAYLESVAEGSTYPAVRADRFKAAPLLLPPLEELNRFEDAVMAIRLRAHQARVESRTLAALRDTLLPQLMSGRLRVKDAEKIVEDAT
ncbi:putative specificity protein s [Streptomyces coelicoflavus ZG0656]|nr:putative specificity protein s [Streptomyces coelicoflavus ZG0656]MZE43891.1 restriction endonuclease subunit S [Streptomyces sp. SID5477]